MYPSIYYLIAELKAAIAHDQGAINEALQRGLNATQPLTLVALGELCALGERMVQTAALRQGAATRLQLALEKAVPTSAPASADVGPNRPRA